MAQKWEFRVVQKKENGHVSFGIHEVHYDQNGNPKFCSGPIEPMAGSVRDLKTEFHRMMKAFDKPILDYDDF